MPATSPLQADDREQLGEYRLRGRLSENHRSIVYSAETGSGERVLVTLYSVELNDSDKFLNEIEALRRLPAFYTSHLLDAGIANGRPYIVTEHVDGPTLVEEVAQRGPLTGLALHRFAVGTVTALVSIHQAGAVHGEFQPGNIILSPDGPRVAGAGVGRILKAASTSETQRVDSPFYLTPEQFAGKPAGPPADLFAWASATVFAATGHAPFEADTPAAAMNRILNEEPDLSALDDPLRGLVAQCLAKNPADRPTAGDALLKLVGHSLLTGKHEPAALPVAVPASRPPKRRGYGLLLGAAGLAIALVSAGGGHLVARSQAAARPATTSGAQSTSLSTAAPSPSPSDLVDTVSAKADPPAPPAATSHFSVPGVDMKVHESPKDAVRLTAYRVGQDTYLRTPGTTTFIKSPTPGVEPAPSPDGTWMAMFTPAVVTFLNQKTNERFTMSPPPPPAGQGPVTADKPTWSSDGKRLLLTLSTQGDTPRPTGFVLMDPAARTSKLVDTTDDLQGFGWYAWLPDGSGVAIGYRKETGQGVLFRDLSGREVRNLDWVGQMYGRRMFSPSGRLFVTYCPSGGTFCLWDTTSGVRQASVAIFFENALLFGWYDDAHLIVNDPSKKTHQIVVMDPRGRAQRVLAEIAADDDKADFLLYYTRS